MNELIYRIALTLLPQIGDVHAKALVQRFGDATAVFRASRAALERTEGIGAVRAQSIKSFRDFDLARKEAAFIRQFGITPLFLTDQQYPQRLLHCPDAPPLLFYKGTADLNAVRMVAIVGTRKNTEYGKAFTEQLVEELAAHDVVVVSGLAYGIDAIAHKAALRNRLTTVGVIAHGLDQIYPAAHTGMAKEIIRQGGGLLTEFFSGTPPDKHHFPLRNRIVAGLCDATVVVETKKDGGSMITAKLADAYHRDVFAVPGRTTDARSEGCNYLIQHNKAILLKNGEELLEVMGWADRKKEDRKSQRVLFPELTEEEQRIVSLLQQKGTLPIDAIHTQSGLSSSAVAAALLNLELQHVIAALPGKQYQLI